MENYNTEIEELAAEIDKAGELALNTLGSHNNGRGAWYAQYLYDKGWRKVENVAKDFSDEIRDNFSEFLRLDNENYLYYLIYSDCFDDRIKDAYYKICGKEKPSSCPEHPKKETNIQDMVKILLKQNGIEGEEEPLYEVDGCDFCDAELHCQRRQERGASGCVTIFLPGESWVISLEDLENFTQPFLQQESKKNNLEKEEDD